MSWRAWSFSFCSRCCSARLAFIFSASRLASFAACSRCCMCLRCSMIMAVEYSSSFCRFRCSCRCCSMSILHLSTASSRALISSSAFSSLSLSADFSSSSISRCCLSFMRCRSSSFCSSSRCFMFWSSRMFCSCISSNDVPSDSRSRMIASFSFFTCWYSLLQSLNPRSAFCSRRCRSFLSFRSPSTSFFSASTSFAATESPPLTPLAPLSLFCISIAILRSCARICSMKSEASICLMSRSLQIFSSRSRNSRRSSSASGRCRSASCSVRSRLYSSCSLVSISLSSSARLLEISHALFWSSLNCSDRASCFASSSWFVSWLNRACTALICPLCCCSSFCRSSYTRSFPSATSAVSCAILGAWYASHSRFVPRSCSRSDPYA
mmetsp:Transcript_36481/g.85731  ORF Transcript_36481/g.85731 Transcript_36481/m.85731 type:complete len:381 (-) Transcript_36481:184-1326(-)